MSDGIVHVGYVPPAWTLTYLGAAIRLELLRASIKAQAGSEEFAHAYILDALGKFKRERGIL